MRRHLFVVIMACLAGCGGGSSSAESGSSGASAGGEREPSSESREGEFQLQSSDTAGQARGERPSEIEASRTHAAMRLFVVDPDAGAIPGIVIKMTAPDGTAFYTGETDSTGYAEVLVPVGQRYDLEYLALGRRQTSASVDVPAGPNQDIRLTLRYRRRRPTPPAAQASAQETASEPAQERAVLEDITFDSGRATLQAGSHARLDRLVEYLTHRRSVRIRIAGHTDNVGDRRRNQALSEARARAVRDYLVERGIAGDRIEAVGYGDAQPVASNDTEEGRAQNRRIEAIEL